MNRMKKSALGAVVVAGALGGGAIGAALTSGVSAAQTAGTPATTQTTTAGAPAQDQGPHQANGKTETPLTGDTKTKAEAAAKAAVPGATVDRSETDADGATYEVHMTKADGSHVTVELDANFKVTATEEGHGH